MNILFLTLSNSFLTSEFKHQRGIYIDLMKEFQKNGHVVYVAVPGRREKEFETRLIPNNGVNVLQIKTGDLFSSNRVFKGIATVMLEGQFNKAIRRHLSKIKFDLVLFSTPPITFEKVVSYVRKRDDAKSYLLLKDIFPQNAIDLNFFSKLNPLYWYFRRKEKKLYRCADFIGCMSPANVDYLRKHNPYLSNKEIEVCPNSIEPLSEFISNEDKKKIREKYGIPQNAFVFFYGGNLGRPQGVDFLLDVIEAVGDQEKVFFLIIGSGTEYSRMEKWFSQNKPVHSKLLPSVSKQHFDQLLQCGDVGLIFLDPRFNIPNFPSRLLSYLECSIPVLAATDINTDLGEIIHINGFGLWCESGDTREFLKHVEFFQTNKRDAMKMGKKGRQYLDNNYLVSHAYKIIIKHFENV